MRGAPIVSRFSTALALAGLLAACGKGPTSPSTTPPPSARPSTTRVAIAGPDSVPPGQTAQFTATASLSDGSTRNVTDEAVWMSGDPRVLSISTSGLATAHQTGDIFVRAAFSGQEGGREVLVLPAGTYKVVGYVEDGEVPVPDARVEVTAGPAAGLFAVTYPFPSGGSYTLLGVSGDTQFRVTKDGYQPLVRTVRVTDHQQINFDLTPLIPRADLSGTYTLTISAAADCRSTLPQEVKTQTYTAVLTQDGARLTATLTGANFVSDDSRTYNSFEGAIEPSRVRFLLRNFIVGDRDTDPDSTSFSDVFVQLTSSTFLAVSAWPGGAATTVSRAGLSGALNGAIEIVQRVGVGPLDWRTISSCRSTGHQFVLSR